MILKASSTWKLVINTMQQISVYVIDKGEVNFIAINDEVEEYYQVAYTVKDAAGKILERDSDCYDTV